MPDNELNLLIAKLLHGEENLISRPTPYEGYLAWYVKSEWTESGYFNEQDAIEEYATDLRAATRDLIEERGDVDFTLKWNGVWVASNRNIRVTHDDIEKAVCYYFIEKCNQETAVTP